MNGRENSDKVIEVFSLLFSITFSLFFPPVVSLIQIIPKNNTRGEKSHKSFRAPDLNKEPLSAFLSQTLRGSLSPRQRDELMNETNREAWPGRPGRSFQPTASSGMTECSPSGSSH